MAPPLLTLRHAHLAYGPRTLLQDVDLQIMQGERICLVGRNGAGKSTLLRVLAGEIELDSGEIARGPATTVAYLPQEPVLPSCGTMRDFVAGGIDDPAGAESRLHHADQILEDFGIDPDREAGPLSGGEGRRLAIARTLVSEPDLLLLDEPTNHLDLTTIQYLEELLSRLASSIVLISHDRAFLRAVSNRTWWLDRANLQVADHGFERFETWSEALLAAEEAEWNRKTEYLKAEEHWLHRGVTARRKRNQGRLRKLHELRREKRERVRQQGSVKLDVTQASRSGNVIADVDSISKRFGDTVICQNFTSRITRGDKIGLIGPNGAGKTTILKLMLGEIEPDEGTVRLGTNIRIARYDQQRESLDLDKTPWETLCPDGGDKVEIGGTFKHVVGYLRDFLFDEAQTRTKLRALSGGERNRLLMAKIMAAPSNMLVLDEPTNDLDMDTLDLLQELLADYSGTLLLVSHDRDFLDRIVTSTIAVEGQGSVQEYAGGYEDYLRQRRDPEPASCAINASKNDKKETSPAKPRPRRLMENKLARELERLPEKIAKGEARIREIESALADPDLYTSDPKTYEQRTQDLADHRAQLVSMEERWLELEAMREEMEAR